MDIHIDLFGCKDGEDVLLRFGEILQFGGPKMNVRCSGDLESRGGWGVNWSALSECLGEIEVGGIWCTAEKVIMPVTLHIYHAEAFAKARPEDYAIMLELLSHRKNEYAREG